MPYADSDFFIALMKNDDRLKTSAIKVYEANKGKIYTSIITVAELLLISKRFGIPAETLMQAVLRTAKVIDTNNTAILLAARYIEKDGVGVFDALHAALCSGEIISSDHIYDVLGITRIKL